MDAVEVLEKARAAAGEVRDLQDRADQLRRTLRRMQANAEKEFVDRQLAEQTIRRCSERLTEMEQQVTDRAANGQAEQLAAAMMIDEYFSGNDRLRTVCVAYYVDGLTVSGVSLKMCLSQGRVKTLKAEALRLLEGISADRYLPDWYPK